VAGQVYSQYVGGWPDRLVREERGIEGLSFWQSASTVLQFCSQQVIPKSLLLPVAQLACLRGLDSEL
jgi:hypothetical protein